MKAILVDTDALFALVNKNDTNHQKAYQISRKLVAEGVEFVASNFVLAEAVTLISYRASHRKAVNFLDKLTKEEFPILRIDGELEKLGYEVFRKQTSKNVSIVDCFNMAILKNYGWGEIFSFDKIYPKNGFKLILSPKLPK